MSDAHDIQQTVLAEIVKKVTIGDGNIIVVKTANDEILHELADAISNLYNDIDKPIRFLLVEESQVDLLREADEEMMRELGWEKIKK